MSIKQMVIKCVTAIICVIAVCITSVSGVDKICDAAKEIFKGGANSSAVTDSSDESAEPVQENNAVDENSIDNPEEIASDSGEAVDVNSGGNSVEKPNVGTNNNGKKAPTQVKSNSNVPSTKAEVLNYYNSAIAKAVNSKVGFYKLRTSDNQKLDDAKAVKLFSFLIYQFMGIGEKNKFERDVVKGNWVDYSHLNVSKLTINDINNATCTESGGKYTVTINLKNGSSSASAAKPVSPQTTALDKCGICIGQKDKEEYDHKDANVIYSAVSGKFKDADVSESYSNAVIKATINPSNGQIELLKMDWDVNVHLKNVMGESPKAICKSHVTYSKFKY